MSELRDRIAKEMDELQQTRDELKVQLHLGQAELKDEWHRLEKRWEDAEHHLRQLGRHASADAGKTAQEVIQDIRESYQRLRKQAS